VKVENYTHISQSRLELAVGESADELVVEGSSPRGRSTDGELSAESGGVLLVDDVSDDGGTVLSNVVLASGSDRRGEDVANTFDGSEDLVLISAAGSPGLDKTDEGLTTRAKIVGGDDLGSKGGAELDLTTSDSGGLVVFEVRDDFGNVVGGDRVADTSKGRGEIRAELFQISNNGGFSGIVSELAFDPCDNKLAT
jgi:hypothetical protein